jgi:hypothetical protein
VFEPVIVFESPNIAQAVPSVIVFPWPTDIELSEFVSIWLLLPTAKQWSAPDIISLLPAPITIDVSSTVMPPGLLLNTIPFLNTALPVWLVSLAIVTREPLSVILESCMPVPPTLHFVNLLFVPVPVTVPPPSLIHETPVPVELNTWPAVPAPPPPSNIVPLKLADVVPVNLACVVNIGSALKVLDAPTVKVSVLVSPIIVLPLSVTVPPPLACMSLQNISWVIILVQLISADPLKL